MMFGLDGAGKTSIVNRFKDRKAPNLPPTTKTIGFNVDTVSLPFATVVIWDAGGQPKIRPLWHCYYHNGDAFIFVVSALDSGRLLEAREEIHRMCKDRHIWRCPLLVLVNKSEPLGSISNPNVTPVEFVGAVLDVATSGFRVWTIRAVSALTGEGLDDAFKWLSDRVTSARLQRSESH